MAICHFLKCQRAANKVGFKRVCAERSSDYSSDVFRDRGTRDTLRMSRSGRRLKEMLGRADQELSNFEGRAEVPAGFQHD